MSSIADNYQERGDLFFSPLPTPKPQRLHWSNLFSVAGLLLCAFVLLLTFAGVPGRIGYKTDGPIAATKPSSNNPLAVQKSIEANMRWIAANSSEEPGMYVGLITSINDSEALIPTMVQAIAALGKSIGTIDTELGNVYKTSTRMGTDMEEMTAASRASGETMDQLGGDVSDLAKSMNELAGSTEHLTKQMDSIQKKADAIAKNGTAQALNTTRSMNATLPESVPAPILEDGSVRYGAGVND